MIDNAIDDRKHLGWDITKYNAIAEMLNENCFQNKQGDWCSIKKAKTKKLKNIRALIKKDAHLSASLIMREYIRRLDYEIRKRNR